MEIREKVQSQGAFSSRAHERSAEIAGTSSLLEVCRLYSAFQMTRHSLIIHFDMSHIKMNTRKINNAE